MLNWQENLPTGVIYSVLGILSSGFLYDHDHDLLLEYTVSVLGNTSIYMLSMGDVLGSWRFRGHLKARPPVLALVQIGVHLPCG
jgi:hypothetical protein